MNAIQTRQRRCSSRLIYNNNATNPNSSSSNTNNNNNSSPNTNNNSILMGSNNGYDPLNYSNFQIGNRPFYPVPDARLRSLPFYDQTDELIQPSVLISGGAPEIGESPVDFKLTIDQANKLAMSLGRKQILLRFCYLDTTCEQDDNFPPDVVIAVNGSNIILPPAVSNPNKPNVPAKRPGQHLDITKQCKLCPYIQNVVDVKWRLDRLEPNRSYVINIIIAEKVSSEILLERVKERGPIDPETTKKLILDSDNEVATTNLQSSLVCPLGKMRMSMPCKSISCQHIPCFDALFYLQMNEKKATWICPVCYKPALYRDLMIDGFFMSILQQAACNVTEVTLNADGSWTPVLKMEQPTSAKNQNQPEVITISDDED